MQKRKAEDLEKVIGLLQELVINEMVEFMVPLAYLACLLACFFGPNAKLIGNVRNGYWQYNPIVDLDHTVKYVLTFFFVDFGSLVVSSVLLWTVCRINLYRVYSGLQKEFGWTFMVKMATSLSAVSKC